MRARPPENLVQLLSGLGLANAGQFARARRHVRRLAGTATIFDSVWIDALVQTRALSLSQAAAINRGDAAQLRLGPFLLIEPSCQLGSLVAYRAREIDSGSEYRLLKANVLPAAQEAVVARLEQLVRQADRLAGSGVEPLLHSGAGERAVWAAHRAVSGITADIWTTRHGRLLPEQVMTIAGQMVGALERLESAGLVHGDVSVRELVLTPHGQPMLTAPGFRAALGCHDIHDAGLTSDAFDSLSPEGAADDLPASASADRFALGVLWWHLLAGRSPWPAGDSLTRIRAIHRARIPNIRFVAPDTPEPLARAIEACTARDPGQRPQHYREIAALLAAAPRRGAAVRRSLVRSPRRLVSWSGLLAGLRPSRQTSLGLAGWALCVFFLVLLVRPWPSESEPALPTVWTAPRGGQPDATAAEGARGASSQFIATAVEQENSAAPAAFSPAAAAPWDERVERAGGLPELILPTDRPLRLASLRLTPGQVVRGASGRRPQISAPPEGIAVDVEDVRFVGVDFVASGDDGSSRSTTPGSGHPCLLQVRAHRVSFERCTFANSAPAEPGLVAIDWNTRQGADRTALALTNRRLELQHCVLTDIDTSIRCDGIGSPAIVIDNTLQLGSGSLIELPRCPRLDEPLSVTLSHVTVRDAAALLAVHYTAIPADAGRIALVANDCVFSPHPAGSLLHFEGPQSPVRLLSAIDWTGQGSVITPQGVLIAWRNAAGQSDRLNPAGLRIAGLVKSEVGFAGPPRAGAAASRAVRWQVPLRSPDPPGIDAAQLPPSQGTVE